MDGQVTRLNRNRLVIGERGHGGIIAGTKDASCYIVMEKISPRIVHKAAPSSEVHSFTIRPQLGAGPAH
jgi:hypothetical protein